MNKLLSKLQLSTIKTKRLYLFLLLIFIIGVIFGSLFITIINETDKNTVINQISGFFNQIKNNNIDFNSALKNSITTNLLYIVAIWILGISIIGIPIIIIMLFLRGFMIGFSIAAIIAKYKLIGIIGGLTYIFPHYIISLIIIFMISYYALRFSFNLLEAVVKKKSINFNEVINRYSFIMIFSIIVMVIASLIETYLSPYIMKLFTLLIK